MIEVTFGSTKLSCCFNVIDNFEHNHDFIYHTKYPEPICIDDYVRECARRIIERIKDHNGRDHISHVLKHSAEKWHNNVYAMDFKIIDKSFQNNKQKRKMAVAL